ncbi:outer membrane beta-barrel family protein [Sediminibacterium ginsengisoli]|uniref:Outer membrane receptor proteins, mostly Fe transport n=1 Tax=Sediminibacterium ginsengisoli TaxID=413434 RepID=A0A1T4QPG5_9BACT|nr:outer membrane beta-barrel family protein [Sediminibacterium ginsengisoli]SKA05639.1 Outer membrane receptor proteins, mostly Fe transport [Sediminibacterium ginsengisoli]
MKKTAAFLTIICAFLCAYSYGQESVVKGNVTDTVSKQHLYNAVITLQRAKDSVLVKYLRADVKGNFEAKVPAGKYLMMVSYPGYVEMIDTVVLSQTPLDMGRIALNTKAHLLQEVIVKQTIAPIRIKGDTTIYMADSFRVKPGATVEDLLKVLPGMTVNSKGEITTQGQKVQKVYVDGDEFFGDDPTMATQNLNSKDVAQVQVFDKKSDQATLTGIDDGEKQKAINLVMKEDAKKGYFGKVEAGTDFNKYYQAKATANRFTSTMKAGAYLTADRTGRNGMSWEEMQDFGNVTTVMDGGDMYMYSEGDEFSSYNTQGIPENLQGSLMYNKKFGKLKSNITNNYTYNHQNLAGESLTESTYILPDSVYYNNLYQQNKSSRLKHTINTKNELKLDSSTTLTINARGSWGRSEQNSLRNGEYLNSKFDTVNTSRRNNYSKGDNSALKADIFLKKTLNKAGTRSFTISTGFTRNTSNSDGYLTNRTDYYNPAGFIDSSQLIDQRKTGENSSSSIQALASYIQPLSKKMSLNLNYTFNTSNSEQDSRSFEKKAGKYDSLNLLFSNHFKYVNTSHRGGLTFNYINKKVTVRAGLAVQELSLKQTNIYKDSSFARDFTNFFPSANFRWKFSQTGNFNLNYNGNTQQPSLSQLQPILNNIDPLNLTIGNPNLKPAFRHSFSLNLGEYKVLTNRNIYFYASYNFTENAFTSRSDVDDKGKRTNQTVNVGGNYDYYTQLSYGRQIKALKLDFSFGPRFNGSRYKSFINSKENVTNSYSITPSLSLNKSVEKKFYAWLSYNPTFNHSESSVNSGSVTEYWIQTIYFELNVSAVKGWVLNTDIDANFRQKLSASERSTNAFIWNASLEKKLFKKQDITAIFSVNDILNQRIGFSRSINSNFITQNTYTTVGNYVMLSLRWKFNKNKKQNEDED